MLFEKLEIAMLRRKAVAERKFWKKIEDNVEKGLHLAGFEKECCDRGIRDHEYNRYIGNRKFTVEIFENGEGGFLHGFENGQRICRDELKFKITAKTPPEYIASRLAMYLFPYEEGGL